MHTLTLPVGTLALCETRDAMRIFPSPNLFLIFSNGAGALSVTTQIFGAANSVMRQRRAIEGGSDELSGISVVDAGGRREAEALSPAIRRFGVDA